MPKIKLKKLQNDNIESLDHVYAKVDIKLLSDSDELFAIDDRVPLLQINMCSPDYIGKIKGYLSSNIDNKFILHNEWEGTSTIMPFLTHNELTPFCDTKQLQIISTGDFEEGWKYANIDLGIKKTGSIYNQIVAVNNFEEMYNPKVKPYKFLFLNGRTRKEEGRPHRGELINLLNSKRLLESALWSDLSNNVLIPEHYKDYFNGGIKEIFINQTNYTPLIRWPDGVLNMTLLTDTYFSVVAETNYNYPQRFYSEKIYKPILAGHPFIAVSNRDFYSQLHQQGYQTFGEFIDESFDNIDDGDARLKKIADSIEQLCNSDLVKFQQGVKEICRHNQQIFLEKLGKYNSIVYNELTKFLGNINA